MEQYWKYYVVGFDCDSNDQKDDIWGKTLQDRGIIKAACNSEAIDIFKAKFCSRKNKKTANERYPVGKGFGFALIRYTVTIWDEYEDGQDLGKDTEEVGIIAEKMWIHRNN